MATPKARVSMYGSALPLSAWGGLALVAIAVAIAWALPQARTLAVIGIAGGLALSFFLARKHRAANEDAEAAAPLHLRE
jgi:hypothetical protein